MVMARETMLTASHDSAGIALIFQYCQVFTYGRYAGSLQVYDACTPPDSNLSSIFLPTFPPGAAHIDPDNIHAERSIS
jgi:hypothetical protein